MIHMRTKLGVNVSYYKVWRAEELVTNSLNGEAKESYALIPNFFTKLKEINPGMFLFLQYISSIKLLMIWSITDRYRLIDSK